MGPQDFHSNAEVAVESANGQQIVEIGWTVDQFTDSLWKGTYTRTGRA